MQDKLINYQDRNENVNFKGKYNYNAFKKLPAMDYLYLKENDLIFCDAVLGSHSYGLAVEDSDIDYRGVYLMPFEMNLGMTNSQGMKGLGRDDAYYYELARFIYILMKNSPHALELLSLPDHLYVSKHRTFDMLADNINLFITNNIVNTYTGYARASILLYNESGKLKQAMHALRVLHQLIDFYDNDEIIVKPSPKTVEYLLDVRKGNIEKEQIHADFNALSDIVIDKGNFSPFKKKHDLKKINDLVIEIRRSFYIV